MKKGIEPRSGEVLIAVDARYFRPTEVDLLVGDPSKAQKRLGWRHKTSGRPGGRATRVRTKEPP
jgi:GDPmannose 4,6-dehydratase